MQIGGCVSHCFWPKCLNQMEIQFDGIKWINGILRKCVSGTVDRYLLIQLFVFALVVGLIFGQCTRCGDAEIASIVSNFVGQIEAAERKHETYAAVSGAPAYMQLHFTNERANTYRHICDDQTVSGINILFCNKQTKKCNIIYRFRCVCCCKL